MVCSLRSIIEEFPGQTTLQITTLLNQQKSDNSVLFKISDIEKDLCAFAKVKICFKKSNRWFITNPLPCEECKSLKMYIQTLKEQTLQQNEKLLAMFDHDRESSISVSSPRESVQSPRRSIKETKSQNLCEYVTILESSMTEISIEVNLTDKIRNMWKFSAQQYSSELVWLIKLAKQVAKCNRLVMDQTTILQTATGVILFQLSDDLDSIIITGPPGSKFYVCEMSLIRFRKFIHALTVTFLTVSGWL